MRFSLFFNYLNSNKVYVFDAPMFLNISIPTLLFDKCFSRINYIKFCPKCNVRVKETEIIKGYEYTNLLFLKASLNK